jgi:tRNA 2-thiouridine synthesizing protein E
MNTLVVNSKTYDVDEEGYLSNRDTWDKDVAIAMAETDDCDLTNDHWDIINLLRDYHEKFQIAPAIRVLTKSIGKTLGKEKASSKYLYNLFPYGPAKQACKYAGLPKPTGCV